MKKKRHRVIDPAKARAAAGGGSSFYPPDPPPEKCCGKCEQLRYSVDDTGTCGYCRAIARVTLQQAADGPDPF